MQSELKNKQKRNQEFLLGYSLLGGSLLWLQFIADRQVVGRLQRQRRRHYIRYCIIIGCIGRRLLDGRCAHDELTACLLQRAQFTLGHFQALRDGVDGLAARHQGILQLLGQATQCTQATFALRQAVVRAAAAIRNAAVRQRAIRWLQSEGQCASVVQLQLRLRGSGRRGLRKMNDRRKEMGLE